MAILAGLWVGMQMSGARAVDITVKSTSSQSLELNSNYLLETNPRGETYLSVSRLAFDTLARTPTMRFAATVDLNYRSYFGPGAALLLPALDRTFRGTLEKDDKLTTYKVEASRSVQQALQLQLAEVGVSTIGGDIITDTVEAGIRHQLSSRDMLAWSARATSLQFTDPTGTPSLDLSTTGSWTHRLNQLTDVIPRVQFESIIYDNAAKTEVMIWRGMIGLNTQLTKRLTFEGAAGVAHLTLDQSGGGIPSTAIVAAPLTSGSAADWIANMLLTYRINNNDTFSLAAAQTIGPDSLGVIRKFDLVGVTLTHRLNYAANLRFLADYSHSPEPTGVATDLYSASLAYDYLLNRDWRASIAYRFRQRVGGPGDANSNAVFISLTHDATILPSASQATPTSPIITALSNWPAAWQRPWRDMTWEQAPP